MSRALLPLAVLLAACQGRTFPSSEELFAEALARFDKDGNGSLSPEELQAYDALPDTFARMDTNQDGKADLEEFTYFMHANQPRALVSRKGQGPR